MSLLKIDSLRSLSRIFTNSMFKNIVLDNDVKYFDYTVKKHIYSKWEYHSTEPRNIEILDYLYTELCNNYCNEYVFKNEILRQELLKKYTSYSEAVLLNEFAIWYSIADVVILNWEIQVFEIKTDLDSFVKLDKQLIDYMKFADKVYIVVSDVNRKKVKSIYKNTNIGILYLNNDWILKEEKKAIKNKDFDYETIFKTLRKKEYLNIIREVKWKKNFENLLRNPNSLIFRESLEIIKTINIKKFQKLALQEIKKRKNLLDIKDYINSAPDSLKYIYYNLELKYDDYNKLENFLYTNFSENVLSIS